MVIQILGIRVFRYGLISAILIVFCSVSASATTLYRCIGNDDVPQFGAQKIAGTTCKVASNGQVFTHAKTAPNNPVPGSTINADNTPNTQVQFKTSTDSSADLKAPLPSKTAKVSRGAIYRKQVDGVNAYTNIGNVNTGAGALVFHYLQIETCYACSLGNTIDFSTIRLNTHAYSEEIKAASQRFGVDEAIVRAIIHAESAYRVNALSNKGAQGLMQLIPATANRFGVNDAFDPQQNIAGGVQYLAFLLKRYQNNLNLVAAAYNAGEGAVDRFNGIPPYKETQNYVLRVGQLADRYRKALKTG